MTSNPTARDITPVNGEELQTYATWKGQPARRLLEQSGLPQVVRAGAMAVFLATPRSVGGFDLWQWWERQRSSSVIGSLVRPLTRRRISLAQARRLAFEIMAQAERERARAAEWEAQRSIMWEA